VEIEDGAAEEDRAPLPRTPRIANRLLRASRLRAGAADGASPEPWRRTALDLLDVDRYGLDEIDQKIMMTILEKYAAGRWA
jgi:Holliday junction DNA helicase RuvB